MQNSIYCSRFSNRKSRRKPNVTRVIDLHYKIVARLNATDGVSVCVHINLYYNYIPLRLYVYDLNVWRALCSDKA